MADRDVIILDDEIARGTTVLELLSVLRRPGAAFDQRRLHARAVRRRRAGEAGRRRGRDRDRLHQLGARPRRTHPKLHVLSVAPALAEAIRRTHDGESVSVLFDN